MDITVHTADLSDIEENAIDLAGAITAIIEIASTSPESVTKLVLKPQRCRKLGRI
jgi:hypothetical protein